MVYVNSGYNTEEAPGTGIHGNVLLAFGLPGSPPRVRTSALASYKPIGTAHLDPPRRLEDWNLVVDPDGTVRPRS